jgi:hypothetical protein
MIETTENGVEITEKSLDIHLIDPTGVTDHVLPAPVTPKEIKIDKYDKEVTIDVVLYLQDGFIAKSIKHCEELIIDPTDETTEKRFISIMYDFTLKEDDLFKPHVYRLKLSDLALDKQEIRVMFCLTNLDPVTSRGTTTTVKREM